MPSMHSCVLQCVLCLEGMDEVVGMFFPAIFDAKVIHCEGEWDWALMFLQRPGVTLSREREREPIIY